ncbi:MAG: D-alanyl-D-alanine carboxypeptidase [Lachnospiraceae bacterium]|jgi:D-alanyl-D-alanine carboxypeptidase (penicillin-binding protein 5/6)|nr:D-alanyl-D-alanine carboxypeptidase [Lachnospiraceae bacterium]
MVRENRIRGLMAGVTIGFAFWGSTQAVWKIPAERSVKTTWQVLSFGESEPSNAGIIETEAKEELSLYALSAVLMDGDTGRILYEKDGEVFRSMASTTKIMTCILALENGNPKDICTVSETAAAQPKVRLGARKGTQFYLKDLLYSLMLESHNDSAVVIAEQIGGSVEGFSAMMNEKAKQLGCKNTCFLTPNGLDKTYTAPDGKEYIHGTTAEDLAAVMRYCIRESPRREEFLEITRTASYAFTDVEKKGSFSCVNHNALLSMMDGLLSGKTGFTDKAGYSYVAALEDEGRTYILALLGSGWPPHKTYKWADARTLFNYGREKYHYQDVYQEPDLKEIPVEDGIGEITGTGAKRQEKAPVVKPVSRLEEKDRHLRILLAEDENVERRAEVPELLKAPVKKGELVGHVRYLLNGKTIRSYPLFADRTVEKRDFSYCFRKVWDRFFGF